MLYTYTHLKSFSEKIFIKIGCSAEDAALAADTLLSADLRGVDSHGVARLSGYIRLWETNRINPKPNVRIIHQTPSTATVDGDAGLGLVVAPKAMKIAIEKADNVGSGWIAVQNSNHFGIAGYHAMMALQHDMIGFAMTNASPLVAPTFSTERLLGTNPIAVAIPAHKQPAFVADFATTTAANGKLEILQRKQQEAPEGWIQNAQGGISTNPNELKNGGALLPLGGDREHGSHKGYCLGAIVDILSAVLSGANYASWVPPFVHFLPLPENPVGKGLGHFLGAMRVDGFRPANEFKENMDIWINRFRTAKTVEGHEKVQIPGDYERETSEIRINQGWELLKPVEDDLKQLALKFGVEF
jgi:LDH2 family malate/lactate/ureidoglycolate dehydrogenase